jgi:hypothetical protein
LTIDSKTQKILKVNGCSWDGETPLSEFHDHPPLSSAEVQKCFVKRDLLEQASTSSGPIPRLFEAKGSELAAAGHSIEDIAEILPQYNSLKSSMYRMHALSYPPIPANLNDLTFEGILYEQYTLTKAFKQRFLLFDGWQDIYDKKRKK